MNWQQIYTSIEHQDIKTLARAISLVENEVEGYLNLLTIENNSKSKIIGITGPPGAGKSSLTDKLIGQLVAQNKKVGVICVDPSSPFNLGSILGDRLRLNEWYLHPNVFIRSLASRGALGGLSPKIVEIVDTIKIANFDYIIIETVGVGQSEIDIVGLADCTVVVLVPESGDEIQTMKAGLMEVADIFVINKYDRPLSELFYHHLNLKLAPIFSKQHQIKIIKTIATQNVGIDELINAIENLHQTKDYNSKIWHLVNKAFELIQKQKMKHIHKKELFEKIKANKNTTFNLYQFIAPYLK